ncbi:MAG: hypothetical protein Q9227_004816 [Pyrenula ochraceoflavens]
MINESKSQYHHFIPRFILEQFAHPYRPTRQQLRNGSKNAYRRGQSMLYTIDLAEKGEVVEAPVVKSFGLTDMYRDLRQDEGRQHHLEQQLSVLESRAGQIISRIRKRYEAGEKDVWMTRKERNDLRRFLFIMKYRSTGFHKRFQHETAHEYSENDKKRLLQYMKSKGFTRPIDVWSDNIKALLDLEMDSGLKWAPNLREKMYPDDAMWALTHIQSMCLALCTPSDEDCEFLVSGNLFGLHEGPTDSSIDLASGKETGGVYTEYHFFAVISPKLMIVLRSNCLPNPEEDADEARKNWREDWYNSMLRMHNYPSKAHSVLESLPVRKANNSYTRFVEGKRVLKEGEDGSPRAYHKFGFPFFRIGSDHVNMITGIILNEAHAVDTLAFHSKTVTLKALEWYLSSPVDEKPHIYGYKVIFEGPADPRLICLKKLENAARSMGSNVSAVYKSLDPRQEKSKEFRGKLENELEKAFRLSPKGPATPYIKLGGSGKEFLYDTDQAQKMLNLRIKIDVWSEELRLGKDAREKARMNLTDFYCREIPTRRILFYCKPIRCHKLRNGEKDRSNALNPAASSMGGPEDVIAEVSHLFHPDRLSKALYTTAMNSIEIATIKMHLEIGNHGGRGNLASADKALAGALLLSKILSGPAGSICDCGVKPIELRARSLTPYIEPTRRSTRSGNLFTGAPFLSSEQCNEFELRHLIQNEFKQIMRGMDRDRPSPGAMPSTGQKVEKDGLEALEEALFGTLYPTIPVLETLLEI